MSLDKFLHKTYDDALYNCGHFVCDVWHELTGVSLHDSWFSILVSKELRKTNMSLRHVMHRIAKPIDPCVIVMSHPQLTTHVGVFTRNKVFHLLRTGARRETVYTATVGYTRIRYYNVENCSHNN